MNTHQAGTVRGILTVVCERVQYRIPFDRMYAYRETLSGILEQPPLEEECEDKDSPID